MRWKQTFEIDQIGVSKKVKQFAWYPVVVGIKQEGTARIYVWAWLEHYTAIYTYKRLSRNFRGLPQDYYGWVFQYGEPLN